MPVSHQQQLRSGIRRWAARHWLAAPLSTLGPLPISRSVPTLVELVELELHVRNSEGIHARPAAAFVRCASEFESEIEIVRESGRFSAKSILEVLTANLACGTVFLLHATGPDARAATERLRALVESFSATQD
jgi:phosphotransferase system HPr (HPr) family protein